MARLKTVLVVAALLWAMPAGADPLDLWSAYVAEASARFSIPQDWIRRVMRAESGGRTMLGGRPIVSPAGAMGLMQLMPNTWRAMRARLGLGDDPHDPHDNILAGAFYLRAMYERFGYPGLFAAYNAGPARFADHLATGRRLPGETIGYVASVAGRRANPVAPLAPRQPPVLFALLAGAHHDPAATSEAPQSSLFVRLSGGPNR